MSNYYDTLFLILIIIPDLSTLETLLKLKVGNRRYKLKKYILIALNRVSHQTSLKNETLFFIKNGFTHKLAGT